MRTPEHWDEEDQTFAQVLRKYWDGKIETCIDTLKLVDYATGFMGHQEEEKIKNHLLACPVCRLELETIEEGIRAADDETIEIPDISVESVKKKLSLKVADLALEGRTSQPIEFLSAQRAGLLGQ